MSSDNSIRKYVEKQLLLDLLDILFRLNTKFKNFNKQVKKMFLGEFILLESLLKCGNKLFSVFSKCHDKYCSSL